MSKRLLTACLALALSAPGLPACAGASDEPWIAAARHAVAFGKAHGLDIVLEVEHGNGLRYHPHRYDAMLGQIERGRRRFLEPKHDTLAWLEVARRDGAVDAEGNIFDVAAQRMLRY